jgi:HAE1 family hydrophobic/amphiphilic exporter-1
LTYNTIAGYSLLSGVNTTYSGFYFVTLEPWEERDPKGLTADVIMRELNRELFMLPEAQAFAFAPPAIPGVGTSGGATFMLEDRSGTGVEFLAKNTEAFLAEARQRPELGTVWTTFVPGTPQMFAKVNRDKVLKQGVDLATVYKTVQTFMGGTFVNYFNLYGFVWQVYVQAEGSARTQADNVGRFYVLNKERESVPLSAVVDMVPTFGPEFLMHYNGYNAAQINASAKPGYSSAQVMAALEEVFAKTQPREMGFDYMGMSYQEQVAAQGVPPSVIFAFSLLMVFLILAAQYESWTLPFSVLLGVPIAVFGAFFALWLLRYDNNVYAQIGLVMLIGLAAKNAILIVEFAKDEYEKGETVVEAALNGARIRLRPILMTAFAFILGCVPLLTATGAGALSRRILGNTVVGGMLAASIIAIFLIPVSFYVVERLSGGKEAEHGKAGGVAEAGAPGK